MNEKESYVDLKVNAVKKIIPRGGFIYRKILTKPEKFITGEEALVLFNTYGVSEGGIALLADSHGLEVDWNIFFKLLYEQNERSKKMVLCNKEND